MNPPAVSVSRAVRWCAFGRARLHILSSRHVRPCASLPRRCSRPFRWLPTTWDSPALPVSSIPPAAGSRRKSWPAVRNPSSSRPLPVPSPTVRISRHPPTGPYLLASPCLHGQGVAGARWHWPPGALIPARIPRRWRNAFGRAYRRHPCPYRNGESRCCPSGWALSSP